MCHESCLEFGKRTIERSHVEGQRVLEVGSCNVNGSLRSYVESLHPKEYLGVDFAPGSGVDVICDATELVDRFGPERWDLVITTEMMEHVQDWPAVVSNLKRSIAPEGYLLLTTRSFGFPLHLYPDDHWRYETWDLRAIFRDFKIVKAESDRQAPGVFLFAQKPPDFVEQPSWGIMLYNMKAERRIRFERAGVAQCAP